MSFDSPIELLAPAKDLDCGISAINFGADAVYIGAPKYGARSAAGNSISDIEKLVIHANKYWAKVYVALNTILFDNELEDARKLIWEIYNVGADAIIIQDMGILEMKLPPIPIFASTQTNNASWQKVKFLEETGLKRVILARELSLNQIKEIRTKTNIDLEFFVHGALCVSYSGQCYLSYAIGGRSANRGECAQPCRMKYDLTDTNGKIIIKNKHLLSLKDLNLSEYLKELMNAGISSFKIEGRLKDIYYVKNVVAFYRQKIDQILNNSDHKKSSSGVTNFTFVPDPEKSFNRGFTNYFINERKQNITSFDTPKSLGKLLGKVSTIYADYFTLESSETIQSGDGICFLSDDGNLYGTNIFKTDINKIFPESMNHILPGINIFRNLDIAFNRKLNSEVASRKINVNLTFNECESGFILFADDEDSNSAVHEINLKKELSSNPEKADNSLKTQLSKSGNSIFSIQSIQINTTQKYFISTSILNNARRNVLDLLDKKRLENYKNATCKIVPNEFPYPEKELDYLANISNTNALNFYKRHQVKTISPALEISRDSQKKMLMILKHCLKYSIGQCPHLQLSDKSFVKEPLYLLNEKNKIKLEFDCKSCQVKLFL